MRDVICKYHPRYLNNKALQDDGMKNPEGHAVERLVEESLAAASRGAYEFVDEVGYDFTDKSDSKTVTVRRIKGTDKTNMSVGKVENKIGALRTVIYNTITEQLDFMYMPFTEWQPLRSRALYPQERIVGSWSVTKQSYGRLEKYRVSSFEELATATDESFFLKHPFIHQEKQMQQLQLRGFKSLIGKATVTTDSKGKQVPKKAGFLESALSAVNDVLGVKYTGPTDAKLKAKKKIGVTTHELTQLIAECNQVKMMFAANPTSGKSFIDKADKDIKKYQNQLDKITSVSNDVSDTRNLDDVRLLKTLIEECIAQVHKLGLQDKSWIENSLRSK